MSETSRLRLMIYILLAVIVGLFITLNVSEYRRGVELSPESQFLIDTYRKIGGEQPDAKPPKVPTLKKISAF